ncbi:hypothetical protein BSU04_31650 [Caballeronia sordidicola]|uniref:Uncharacterized protein n=1 Tax=Caballeronia sordidicola TaxID=196367 RepID=A0A226WUE0_CABSO|nr:hypothetical protein BSU04_31650 [Caballeronia sordidicola]
MPASWSIRYPSNVAGECFFKAFMLSPIFGRKDFQSTSMDFSLYSYVDQIILKTLH